IYNKKTVSIAEQQKDKESLLTYYKRLIRLKTSRTSLLRGKFKAVELPFRTSKASSWMMEDEDESALVIHNLSAEENLQGPLPEGWTDARMIFATDSRSSADGQMDIAPLSTIVLLR
ncbi:MAG TPA: alpha-amylase, partial [Treponema sp.]|nr:alpha-amylase [Treponema sp.]